MVAVAAASTAFHGAQVFGDPGAQQTLVPRLLKLDLIAANGYGLVLACTRHLLLVVLAFALPLVFLFASAVLKRTGRPMAFAAGHGLWHCGSAAALGYCLYDDPRSRIA